tara:strand:+ start:9824 stop:10024 length:201 start_codon:yes stop_codon:yes gene_type:complete
MFGNLFNGGGFSGGVTTARGRIGMGLVIFLVVIFLFIILVYLLPSNSVTDNIKKAFNKVLPGGSTD